jgi:hypothetical protein
MEKGRYDVKVTYYQVIYCHAMIHCLRRKGAAAGETVLRA